MKIIEVSENILNINEILNSAGTENIILKISDGREFILAEIDSFDRELELTRQNEELMDFLDRRSEEGETYTLEEVKQQLGI
jgi:hypothetical protein